MHEIRISRKEREKEKSEIRKEKEGRTGACYMTQNNKHLPDKLLRSSLNWATPRSQPEKFSPFQKILVFNMLVRSEEKMYIPNYRRMII